MISLGLADVMPQKGNPMGDIAGKNGFSGRRGRYCSCRVPGANVMVWELLDKSQFSTARNSLGAAVHIKFAVDILEMLFDRTRCDNQPAGDIFVGKAFS